MTRMASDVRVLGRSDKTTIVIECQSDGKMREIGEKVLERLATSDKTTIVIECQSDGKMRVTSGSWDGEKVFLKDQVLEVRHAIADARLHGSRNQGTGRVGPTDPGAMTRMARATPRATSSLITETALRPGETALRRMQRRCAGMQRRSPRMQRRCTFTDRSRL